MKFLSLREDLPDLLNLGSAYPQCFLLLSDLLLQFSDLLLILLNLDFVELLL